MHDTEKAVSRPDLEDQTLLPYENILIVVHHMLVSLLVEAV